MRPFTIIRQGAAVLLWSCCVYGLPITGSVDSTTESVTDSSSNDDFMSKVDWGTAWTDFLGSHLTDQCAPGYGSAQLQPAINLFTCLETEPSGQLSRFFSGMGFNLTQQRLMLTKYIEDQQRTTAESVTDSMETTIATTTSVPQFAGTTGLSALLRQIAMSADDLCLNTDAFMNCMDQFLFACYPNTTTTDDSTSSTTPETSASSTASYNDQWLRDVSSFVDMFNTNRTDNDNSSTLATTEISTTEDTVAQNTTSFESQTTSEYTTTESGELTRNSTSDTNSNDTIVIEEIDVVIMVPDNEDDSSERRNKAPVGFFSLPYMINAAQISQFLRRELEILCESNSDMGPKNHRPLSDVMGGVFCLLDDSRTDSKAGQCQRDTEPYTLIDKPYFNCIVNDIHEHCTRNGADTMHMMIDEYEDTATGIAQEMTPTTTTETIPETTTDVVELSTTPQTTLTNSTSRNATANPFWWLVA